MKNVEIARIFLEISEYLEMQGVAFKPRAYERAANALLGLNENVTDIYKQKGRRALENISGVGISIAEKIEELLKTGRLKYYEELKKKTPVVLSELNSIEGLGPKKIRILYDKLKIKNLVQLERAARKGKIRVLAGFGRKSEENILKGIAFLRKSDGKFLLNVALSQARKLKNRLQRLKTVKQAVIAGSVRRRKEMVRDIDILVVAQKGAAASDIMNFFVSMPEVATVIARGLTKSSVKLKSGIDVDIRVLREKSYGAALNYFTGSKEHNIKLRELALARGYKLNEYGLFKGDKRIAGRTEAEIYKALGMAYIEPELREMAGELKFGKLSSNKLPNLIGYNDLKGDLQVQTNWSDGFASIEKMGREAAKLGLEYILITDHSKRLAMANGLNERRLLQQIKEIDKINAKFKKERINMVILKGSECDILKDGKMDLRDDVLEKLDIVGGAVHSYFNLSKKEQTERIKRAMKNPNVDIIFHPTGRILKKRPAYDLDMNDIIKNAKRTGTVLEIDAFPNRLDIEDEHIRKCVEAGVLMSISSDAHSAEHFSMLEYGIAQARRGWAAKENIINAWPLEKMLKMLKR